MSTRTGLLHSTKPCAIHMPNSIIIRPDNSVVTIAWLLGGIGITPYCLNRAIFIKSGKKNPKTRSSLFVPNYRFIIKLFGSIIPQKTEVVSKWRSKLIVAEPRQRRIQFKINREVIKERGTCVTRETYRRGVLPIRKIGDREKNIFRECT